MRDYRDDIRDIAENIEKETSYKAKIDFSAYRIHVSRKLSRGWQDMGYIEVDEDGVNFNTLNRNKAGIRNAAGIE